MVSSRLRQFVIAALLMPIVATMGCNSTNHPATTQTSTTTQVGTSPKPQLKVVTTFLPMYLFTKAVAGNTAQVDILVKPGTEVHEYQSTPTDVQAIAQANVVVKNGMGLEAFLENTIKNAENPQLKVIDASQGIASIEETSQVVSLNTSQDDHANAKDHADEKAADQAATHTHGDGNPHVWLNPVLAQKQVENIRDGLIAADPANKTTYQANAAAYIQQLTNLNQQFEQSLKKYQDRTFVTFHDAFPYLAKQYQLQQVAVVEIPEDQLSPTDVQTTVAAVKLFKVKALFGEPGIDNKLLSTLSQDLKLTVYPLSSLEAGDLDPQYYFTAMKTNLQNLETAFK